MSGFTVQLVASSTKTVFGRPLFPAFAYTVPLDGGFAGSLRRLQLLRAIGPFADVVAAAVTYDDPTESADQSAPYTLTVTASCSPAAPEGSDVWGPRRLGPHAVAACGYAGFAR